MSPFAFDGTPSRHPAPMIRDHRFPDPALVGSAFRLRGKEMSRLEALSDAVFGFAITLLVVSLEVPQTFSQLMETMAGFVAFAASFAMLFLVWFHQYRFFRRYGMNDGTTVVLNAVLLFVVLFFVYPLKFLYTFVINTVFLGHAPVVRLADGTSAPVIEPGQVPQMMTVFGAAYISVFLVFAALYAHAYRRRAELELDEVEVCETRGNVRENLLNVAIGGLSIAIAVAGGPAYTMLSGLAYMLLGPVLTLNGIAAGRQIRRIRERAAGAVAG